MTPIHLCCLEPADGPHASWCTPESRADETRQQRRQRERQEAKAGRGPDLHAVHEIDQSHASAGDRIDSLLAHLKNTVAAHSPEELAEAIENPMLFIAIVKILEQRVDVTELPYMLSAAILRLAAHEIGKE